jgi:hypothetical protein
VVDAPPMAKFRRQVCLPPVGDLRGRCLGHDCIVTEIGAQGVRAAYHPLRMSGLDS